MGRVTFTNMNYNSGSKATFECNEEYTLMGPRSNCQPKLFIWFQLCTYVRTIKKQSEYYILLYIIYCYLEHRIKFNKHHCETTVLLRCKVRIRCVWFTHVCTWRQTHLYVQIKLVTSFIPNLGPTTIPQWSALYVVCFKVHKEIHQYWFLEVLEKRLWRI